MQDFVINQAKTGQQHAATVKEHSPTKQFKKRANLHSAIFKHARYTRLTPEEEQFTKKAAEISQMLSRQTHAFIVG